MWLKHVIGKDLSVTLAAMDPAARKSRKGGRGFARPFYATDGQTSAEIVSEARQNVRTVETKRPFTPVEQTRTLFGVTGSTAPVKERPASSFRFEMFVVIAYLRISCRSCLVFASKMNKNKIDRFWLNILTL